MDVPDNISQGNIDWPHAPVHRLGQAGTYIVTAGTYRKELLFRSEEQLNYLQKALFVLARQYEWQLQAWAIFPNHYHFVAQSDDAASLRRFVQYFHSASAKFVNRVESRPGRKVWHQYWDSHITFHNSFLARLNYVHTNAVKHGLVREATLYPWCSAAWFARTAPRAFYTTVMSFPSDQLGLPDEFQIAPTD